MPPRVRAGQEPNRESIDEGANQGQPESEPFGAVDAPQADGTDAGRRLQTPSPASGLVARARAHARRGAGAEADDAPFTNEQSQAIASIVKNAIAELVPALSGGKIDTPGPSASLGGAGDAGGARAPSGATATDGLEYVPGARPAMAVMPSAAEPETPATVTAAGEEERLDSRHSSRPREGSMVVPSSAVATPRRPSSGRLGI